eukprot:TRINITY_DN23669_c0_g1_i3.p1 TRINITY_DN23669_c0_g1~~TRINITY_DN23669_c0_g1_i3.p1  ORF type:complete len:578 (+),score=97.76 TRINITY_DN23669_c0_g1_i3:158-1891(+)
MTAGDQQQRGSAVFGAWTGKQADAQKFLDRAAHQIMNPDEDQRGAKTGNLYKEINQLKQGGGKKLTEDDIREKAKYHNGLTGQMVKSKKFEATTITVIMLNALEIGWDSDYSARNGSFNLWDPGTPKGFLIAENAFAAYFTFEILTRFFAYKEKLSCLRDPWFVFDALLVTFMVVETWLMPFMAADGSPLGQLSILRLLRLLRITRMAKLMKAFPELMMIIKGIVAATKAVVWTVILLVIVTYTWAILFTNEYHQGPIGDLEVEDGHVATFFGSMGKSMLSLLIMGTILDDVTACSDMIRSTGNYMMLAAFLLYILINSFTLMNMLVGILVEVVGNTAEGEKQRVLEEYVRESIKTIFRQMDKDESGRITRAEFLAMRRHKTVMKSLADLKIKEKQFDMYTELLFEPDATGEASISFEKLLNMLLRLRPGTSVSALDFASFKQLVCGGHTAVTDRLSRLANTCDAIQKEAVKLQDRHGDEPPSQLALSDTKQVGLSVDDGRHCKININMLTQLDKTSSTDILNELQRRLGLQSLEDTGVPMSMMDEELQERIRAAEAFQTLGVPQPEPEWSKDTRTC